MALILLTNGWSERTYAWVKWFKGIKCMKGMTDWLTDWLKEWMNGRMHGWVKGWLHDTLTDWRNHQWMNQSRRNVCIHACINQSINDWATQSLSQSFSEIPLLSATSLTRFCSEIYLPLSTSSLSSCNPILLFPQLFQYVWRREWHLPPHSRANAFCYLHVRPAISRVAGASCQIGQQARKVYNADFSATPSASFFGKLRSRCSPMRIFPTSSS